MASPGSDGGPSNPHTSHKQVHAAVRNMAAVTPVLLPALWTASMDGGTEEVRRLLGEEVDIESRGGMNAGTPLHVACSYGRVEVLLLLIEHGADVSFQDIHGRSPLHAAAIQGDLTFSRDTFNATNTAAMYSPLLRLCLSRCAERGHVTRNTPHF